MAIETTVPSTWGRANLSARAAPFQLEQLAASCEQAVKAACFSLGRYRAIDCNLPLSLSLAARSCLGAADKLISDEEMRCNRGRGALPPGVGPVGLNRADVRQGIGI